MAPPSQVIMSTVGWSNVHISLFILDPSPCHFALEAASGTHLLGVHIPDCNEDGTFKEKQCHSSTGYCWCVDPKNGSEIKGSRKGPTDGQVNCGMLGLYGSS